MWSKDSLFAVVLCSLLSTSVCQAPGCSNPPGIVLTPNTNQTVAINSDEDVVYRCNVDNDRRADMVFKDIPISQGSDEQALLASRGIVVSAGSNVSEVIMTINSTGRNSVINRGDIGIACSALDTDALTIVTGCNYYIKIFDVPEVPPNLDFNPFPGNLSRLVLTWDAPDNTVFDSGDPVLTTYTVTVSGPTVNFVENTTETRFEFSDNVNDTCAMHTFQVAASNEAGTGPADVINETIPISPDIRDLSDQLRVDRITVTFTTATVELTFPKAIACSGSFPLTMYNAHVDGVMSTSFSVDDPRVAGRDVITVSVAGVPANQPHMLSVSACISVTCRESVRVPFMTTDVQSASITFFERETDNNVYLSCTFATSSQAQGCVFIFTISPNVTEEIRVERVQSEARVCEVVQNMENVYMDIQVFDWESNGTYGNQPVVPVRSRADSEEEYFEDTGCTPPPPVMVVGLPVGGIVGIVVAVLSLAVVATVVVIVIVIVCYGSRTKARDEGVDLGRQQGRQEGRAQGREEGRKEERSKELCLDCKETDTLLGRDSPDKALEALPPGVRGGPPPPPGVRGGPPPPRVAMDSAAPTVEDKPTVRNMLHFNVEEGRQKGKMKINRKLLDKLMSQIGDNEDDETEYEFLLPVPAERT